MTKLPFSLAIRTVGALLLTVVAALAAHAEQADRFKPLTIQADQGGQVDLQRQVVVFTGNVVVTKGTMVIRAGRIEVRQTPDGYDTAVAFGTPGQPATFRQKRDGVDETMAGQAEQIEYDGKADVVKFINNAVVRRLRGATPADEISGNLITYDSTTDVLSVTGGATRSATNPDGRVRAVLIPREGSDAASAAAAVPLRLSPALAASAPRGASSGAGKP